MSNDRAFTLVEAVLAVVIVSVCLSVTARSLLSNSRSGARFQQTVRQMLAMENALGMLEAANGPVEKLSGKTQPLEEPYADLTYSTESHTEQWHLASVQLSVRGPGAGGRGLGLATMIYDPQGVPDQ